MKPTITVKYSCPLCGAKDEEVIVPARLSPEEDVVTYVTKTIMNEVARQHTLRHLLCEATYVENLLIPTDETDPNFWIGKAKR